MELQDWVASLSRQQKIEFELSSIDGLAPNNRRFNQQKIEFKLSSIDGGYPLQVGKPPNDALPLTHYSAGHEVPPKKSSGTPQVP